MTEILTVSQRAEELALDTLAGLTASDWGQLGELARKHTRGELSYDAWASATLAVLDGALAGACELDGLLSVHVLPAGPLERQHPRSRGEGAAW